MCGQNLMSLCGHVGFPMYQIIELDLLFFLKEDKYFLL